MHDGQKPRPLHEKGTRSSSPQVRHAVRTITWSIDGAEFMRFDDPLPLEGTTHNRFGFSSWEAQLYFDNLSIQAL